MIAAEISVDDPDGGLIHSMLPETQIGARRRSRFRFSYENGRAVCRIEADDLTAMKASVNTVLQILAVYEKTREMIKNGNNT